MQGTFTYVISFNPSNNLRWLFIFPHLTNEEQALKELVSCFQVCTTPKPLPFLIFFLGLGPALSPEKTSFWKAKEGWAPENGNRSRAGFGISSSPKTGMKIRPEFKSGITYKKGVNLKPVFHAAGRKGEKAIPRRNNTADPQRYRLCSREFRSFGDQGKGADRQAKTRWCLKGLARSRT